jgi:uncharacterized protein YbjT (DUF2867 family)
MRVILFGATGMVGQGVLRECVLDPQVETVLSVGRTSTGQSDPKLREIVHGNLNDLAPIEDELRGYDACFFCLGVSSAGMSEDNYRRVTYDLTVAVGQTLARLNSAMTFIYVSGAGTDSSEHGRSMWARVKGRTENALMRMPFKAAYMFRPGVIRPLHGTRSKTKGVRLFYTVFLPILLLVAAVAPNSMTTTEKMGRAMIHAAGRGAPKTILGTRDINALANRAPGNRRVVL